MKTTRRYRSIRYVIIAAGTIVFGKYVYGRYVDHQLVEAVRSGDGEAVRAYLARGANPNLTARRKLAASWSDESEPLTQIAAELGDAHSLRALLDRGAVSGKTVLSPLLPHAVSINRADIIQILLDHGADVHYVSPEGDSLLFKAGSCIDRTAYTTLRKRGAVPTLFDATMNDDLDSVRALLRAGANPNVSERWGQTPLLYAMTRRNVAIAIALLEGGADPNRVSERGEEAILSADSAKMVRVLLDRGANPNARLSNGGTLLNHFRGLHGPEVLEVVRELEAHHARDIPPRKDFAKRATGSAGSGRAGESLR